MKNNWSDSFINFNPGPVVLSTPSKGSELPHSNNWLITSENSEEFINQAIHTDKLRRWLYHSSIFLLLFLLYNTMFPTMSYMFSLQST